ncbi:MAG: endonuclease/exonuclease/phosphatase family protein [Chitinophagales bacterium]|nr:endonuclease/exonuclease/phosphatase family protein [Chitinophagales bacterium]MDW8419586.1 endonuclease/exonuclease/phosphatase family protein [Chitinophagales bacterium]
MKHILLIAGVLIAAAILYVGGMLLFGIITRYRPKPVEIAEITPPLKTDTPAYDSVYTFLIWNVGYGGLGKEVDFFYDGGKMVTSPLEHVLKNNRGLTDFLKSHNDVDFILLQEVDRNSKRSYRIDQAKQFAEALPGHYSAFAPNFDVKFFPFPFTDPIGKVYGGLQSLSRYEPSESKRIALPDITDFPRRVFYLRRCLLLQRFPLPSGRDLVVINTHFEAYDDGSVKQQQMAVTKKILDEEYARGNFVVIGGDWNIAPPGFDVHKFEKTKEDDPLYLRNNDPSYMPGWTFAFDSTVATNRKNNFPYDPARSYTTVIDYYLVSPNLEVVKVQGIDLSFEYSDHQPVWLQLKLKP